MKNLKSKLTLYKIDDGRTSIFFLKKKEEILAKSFAKYAYGETTSLNLIVVILMDIAFYTFIYYPLFFAFFIRKIFLENSMILEKSKNSSLWSPFICTKKFLSLFVLFIFAHLFHRNYHLFLKIHSAFLVWLAPRLRSFKTKANFWAEVQIHCCKVYSVVRL